MRERLLIVTADDFGIGPATSAGILDLAEEGLITATVLLVTSPNAEDAVEQWRRRCPELHVGWHPCLTLDSPILSPRQVPSLVRPDGRFWFMSELFPRVMLMRICPSEVEAELKAQFDRFQELTGSPPASVNGHHHIHVWPTIGRIVEGLLSRMDPPPYVRRVRESCSSLVGVPGARVKRGLLSLFGHIRFSERFPGNDTLMGVTDPRWVSDPRYLTRWLEQVPGRVVELTCHPGRLDDTLPYRDGGADDMRRRVEEARRLRDPSFRVACRNAGFTLTAPELRQVIHAG